MQIDNLKYFDHLIKTLQASSFCYINEKHATVCWCWMVDINIYIFIYYQSSQYLTVSECERLQVFTNDCSTHHNIYTALLTWYHIMSSCSSFSVRVMLWLISLVIQSYPWKKYYQILITLQENALWIKKKIFTTLKNE